MFDKPVDYRFYELSEADREKHIPHYREYEAAHGRGFDYEKEQDPAWSQWRYKHPHIQSHYRGFVLGLQYHTRTTPSQKTTGLTETRVIPSALI